MASSYEILYVYFDICSGIPKRRVHYNTTTTPSVGDVSYTVVRGIHSAELMGQRFCSYEHANRYHHGNASPRLLHFCGAFAGSDFHFRSIGRLPSHRRESSGKILRTVSRAEANRQRGISAMIATVAATPEAIVVRALLAARVSPS